GGAAEVWQAVGLGLGITLAQLAAVLLLAGTPDLPGAYRKLLQWDSGWYHHIITQGYRSTIPPVRQDGNLANVAFFPGYPVWSRLVAATFRLGPEEAMLLAAQLAAWGFWTYFLLLLRRAGTPRGWQAAGVVALAAHPTAFVLVCGMSESLF